MLESIARQTGGYVRDAESLLGQILSLDKKKITKEQAEIIIPPSNFNLIAEFVEYIINKDKVKAIEQINKLVDDGVDLTLFSKDLIEFLRKLLFSKISNTLDNFAIGLDKELENKVAEMKKKVELNYLIRALKIFIVRGKELKSSEIVQLPMEIAIIELAESESGTLPTLPTGQAGGRQVRNFTSRKETALPASQPLAEKLGDKTESSQEGAIKKTFNFATQVIKKVTHSEDKKDKPCLPAGRNKKKEIKITFAEIEQKWPVVIEYIREHEPALSFMLGAARPQKLKGDILEIGFKHKFHCESLQVNGKQAKLEKILHKILGEPLQVSCFADLTIDLSSIKIAPAIKEKNPELKNVDDNNENDLRGVLEMFGGKVVE